MTFRLSIIWLYSNIGNQLAVILLLVGIVVNCGSGQFQLVKNQHLTLSKNYPFEPKTLESAKSALIALDGSLVYKIADKNQIAFSAYLENIRAENCKVCISGCSSNQLEALKSQIRTRNHSYLMQLQIRLNSLEAKYTQIEAQMADLNQFKRRRSLLETIAEERFEKFGNAWLTTYQNCNVEKSPNHVKDSKGLFLAYYTAVFRFLEILPPNLRNSF